jgi:hypothetical protein
MSRKALETAISLRRGSFGELGAGFTYRVFDNSRRALCTRALFDCEENLEGGLLYWGL